jgi:hypothetical protein
MVMLDLEIAKLKHYKLVIDPFSVTLHNVWEPAISFAVI